MGAAPHSFARLHRHADTAGAAASVLCLIHCLLTPVLISLFPDIIPYLPGDASFHRVLAIGILGIGVLSFLPGYRLHRRRSLLMLVGAGLALVLAVAWNGESLSPALELALSIPGSLMLVTAHLLNRSFCRQCRSCKDHPEPCATTQIP